MRPRLSLCEPSSRIGRFRRISSFLEFDRLIAVSTAFVRLPAASFVPATLRVALGRLRQTSEAPISKPNNKSKCSSPNCGCHRKTTVFGPGTLIMLAAVAIIAVVGFINAPAPQVARRSQLPSPTGPLAKPEPELILSHPGLKLTAAQERKLKKIDSAWRQEKARLQMAMSGFTPERGRVDQISGSLQEYSQLSREFDAVRSHHWSAALEVLTPAQQKEVRP